MRISLRHQNLYVRDSFSNRRANAEAFSDDPRLFSDFGRCFFERVIILGFRFSQSSAESIVFRSHTVFNENSIKSVALSRSFSGGYIETSPRDNFISVH
jgi:hypothetical protein